ncbi:MAG: DUF3891 family protein [Chroococcidiopsidaceae cyanobacterium CP_BM_ER_R8_30]|nr:DUF3891 family protein [Chroococcidiopsidaceae cyanobacterium CP_BM_ER_R8_30]
MLHRKSPEGLICITQPLHAQVSGQLARAWGNEDFGHFVPSQEVCVAAEQHDIGWLWWEAAPTLNPHSGYPHQFTELPTEVHVGIWVGAKQLALPLGRYVALLVSMHGTGLYERFTRWQNSPKAIQIVQDFLKREYTFQSQLIASLRNDSYYAPYVMPEVIGRNRQLVAIWDALSIILCQGFQGEQQVNQVPTASGATKLTLTAEEDNPFQIAVSPWPFQQTQVTLTYEGHLLHETFTDETAMREALRGDSWRTISTTLKPMY